VIEDFQIDAGIGYFIGRDFVSAEREDDGGIGLATGDPDGLTDLLVTGKYRILKGRPGNLSIIAGVKFPTGRDDAHLSNDEPLHSTDQPGTGRSISRWGWRIRGS
jgi:hypothetical protein